MAVLAGQCSGRSRTEVDVEAAIEEKVQERLAIFRKRQIADCRKKAVELASTQADSILIARARQERSTEVKPARPGRPNQPTAKTLSDSLELAPLFERPVLVDSTGR